MPNKKVLTASRLRLLRTFEASYKPEPWAVSILNYIKHRARKLGEGLVELEPYHIEALTVYQGYRCSACDEPFVLPTAEELSKARGYSKWLRSLPEVDRLRAPLPVRAEADEPWGPGNIILLFERWAMVYEEAGGSVAFHEAVLKVGRRLREGSFIIMDEKVYPEVLINLAEAKLG